MDEARTLVTFVTRAESRIETLLALASDPQTRQELQTETDIPRATLSRILADFRDRDLLVREGHTYRLTTLGARLASELQTVFDAVEEARAIETVNEWLPTDELAIDLAALSTVEVTLPTPVDPMAPVKRAAAIVGDSSLVRAFCYSVLHAPILAEARAVIDEGQRFEAVLADAVLEIVAADHELAAPARELFEAGQATVFVYEGAIEPQLIIAGETTMFLVTDDDGAVKGLVEIDDQSILPWAERTFEQLKSDATPLDAEEFAERLTT